MVDLIKYEKELAAQGYKLIAGTDECGVSPIAGALTVCAIIVKWESLSKIRLKLTPRSKEFRVIDSKLLSLEQREKLYPIILNHAIDCSIHHVPVKEIDELNVYYARERGWEEALAKLKVIPDFILGDHFTPKLIVNGSKIPSLGITKGDRLSVSIAASSIVAKVIRDRLMKSWDDYYPGYGWKSNVGYGTPEHLKALREKGITPLHRKSFRHVKEVLEMVNLMNGVIT